MTDAPRRVALSVYLFTSANILLVMTLVKIASSTIITNVLSALPVSGAILRLHLVLCHQIVKIIPYVRDY